MCNLRHFLSALHISFDANDWLCLREKLRSKAILFLSFLGLAWILMISSSPSLLDIGDFCHKIIFYSYLTRTILWKEWTIKSTDREEKVTSPCYFQASRCSSYSLWYRKHLLLRFPCLHSNGAVSFRKFIKVLIAYMPFDNDASDAATS